MSKVIVVTSGKGGVGKTTSTASIGAALAQSADILRASNLGAPVTINSSASVAGRAYRDAARRLAGESVPITMPDAKKTLLTRAFGRRAAA